jgi:ethanolamine ammonia-lyase large subunit
MHYTASLGGKAYRFPDLRTLLARASPLRSADELAGLAAGSEEERAVAQQVLADVPLRQFLEEPLIDPEIDEVSRLVLQSHSQDS